MPKRQLGHGAALGFHAMPPVKLRISTERQHRCRIESDPADPPTHVTVRRLINCDCRTNNRRRPANVGRWVQWRRGYIIMMQWVRERRFYQCVAIELAKQSPELLGAVPLVGPPARWLGLLAAGVIDRYREESQEDELRGDLEHVAAVHQQGQAEQLAGEAVAAADVPAEAHAAAAAYLTEMPAHLRRTLRRPADLRGTTVPQRWAVHDPHTLALLLPAAPPRFQPGDRPAALRGDWELVTPVGVGGMGRVWHVRHVDDPSMQSAVKFFLDDATGSQLRHEAGMVNAVARLGDHPGIVPLRGFSTRTDPPWLRYDYMPDGDLLDLMAELTPLPLADRLQHVVPTLLGVAEAVHFVHDRQPPIVHRDLKPANVLRQRLPDGSFRYRVSDFGIGRRAPAVDPSSTHSAATPALATAPTIAGAHTPLYASPQQIAGDPPDIRDDVHAFGVLAYQLLVTDPNAGMPRGRGWHRRLAQRGVPDPFLDLIEDCVDHEPEERPATMRAVAERLQALTQPAIATENEPNEPPAGPTDEHATADFAEDYTALLSVSLLGKIGDHLQSVSQDRIAAWGRAADAGDPQAAVLYGAALTADCVAGWADRDKGDRLTAAANHFRTAADAGNPAGMNNLGYAYDQGRGVTQDHAEAVRWYRKAADAGNPSGMNNLGYAYAHGEGVTQDHSEAVRWYRKAADAGNPAGMNNLGYAYAHGQGVAQDQAEAVRWYRKAADEGHKNAKVALERLGG